MSVEAIYIIYIVLKEIDKRTPYLIAPLIDNWHVDVVNEDGHLLPSGRSVGGAHAFVYIAFDGLLKHARQGS